jgi:hypothetical protein
VEIYFTQRGIENKQTDMKQILPSKEKIEENYGYSIHEACTRLGIGINSLKQLCRSYNIPRWPKSRKKTRKNNDCFQSFSIKGDHFTQNKPQSIVKQTKALTKTLEKPNCIKIQDNNKSFPPSNENLKDENHCRSSKMSIFNLCNSSN